MSLLQNSNAIEAGGYPISNSLRFQSASSQYLTRTQSAGSGRTKFTLSWWAKKGATTSCGGVEAYFNSTNFFLAGFDSSNNFIFYSIQGGVDYGYVYTPVYRDPSAWYHVVVSVDTTLATASDRFRLYINGTQVTAIAANYGDPPLNYATDFFSTAFTHSIGRRIDTGAYFDGYMAEFNVVDGQGLTPSSFGQTDTLTGQWVAKKYTGTYGTNGFYLPFNDGTSTTTLGYDSSGNSNNWTLTNFTRSAGVSDCWMYDVPSGNGGVAGTQPNSNYCVLNPIYANTQGIGTVSNSNLRFTFGNATTQALVGTFGASTGKWYWEFIASANPVLVGIRQVNTTDRFSNSILWGGSSISATGDKWVNGTSSAYAGASWTTGDVIGVAVDMDGGTITFYKNNTSQGSINLSLATITDFVPAFNNGASTAFAGNVNFGNRSFSFSPPSGFKALCTANLPEATIKKGSDNFNVVLAAGASIKSAAEALYTSVFEWIKDRANANNHQLLNSQTGLSAVLQSNTTGAETTYSAPSGNSVGWVWKIPDSAVTNTNGTISSQVRANPTAGVSVVTWTNTGSVATIGHGLGIAPKMVIVKGRSGPAGATNWQVYHAGLNNGINPQQYGIQLNLTNAQSGLTARWNDTAPTSSVFTIGTSSETGGTASELMVAYCFAEIAGFSKFGSYTGNGSADGPFVYCGFRPKFVLLKNTAVSSDWCLFDTARNTYNYCNLQLSPNLSSAEVDTTSLYPIDIVSNGFKIRASGGYNNTNGQNVIFMAFAENPFQNSNAR